MRLYGFCYAEPVLLDGHRLLIRFEVMPVIERFFILEGHRFGFMAYYATVFIDSLFPDRRE